MKLRSWVYICFIVVLAACNSPKFDPNQVVIHHDVKDSVALSHFNEIRNTPVFLTWKFNQFGEDTASISGFSFPQYVSYSIEGKMFTNIGLYASPNTSSYQSTIPSPKFICAFCSDPDSKTLKIIDSISQKHVDFWSDEGQELFEHYLKVNN